MFEMKKQRTIDELRANYPITFNLKNLVIAKGLLEIGYEYDKYYSAQSRDGWIDEILEANEGWSLYLRRDEENAVIAMHRLCRISRSEIASCENEFYLLWLDDYRLSDPIALTLNMIARSVQSLSLKENHLLILKALYGQNRSHFTDAQLGISAETKDLYNREAIDYLSDFMAKIAAIEQFKRI